MNEILDSEKIFSHLTTLARESISLDSIEVFAELESTQSYLRSARLAEGMSIVVAESQLSGKGRMNRSWHSSAAENIMFSCSWCYEQAPEDLPALSLALIVSLAEYIKTTYDVNITIKWPNDLLLNDKKLAGLLLNVETGKQCKVIAGLGLNIKQSFNGDTINQPWADLSQYGICNIDRNKMIAEIVSLWTKVFIEYPQTGFVNFQTRWNNLAHFRNKPVVVYQRQTNKNQIDGDAKKMFGIFLGVNSKGYLLLDDNGKIHSISDSSFSLRPIET